LAKIGFVEGRDVTRTLLPAKAISCDELCRLLVLKQIKR
jgi:hypothetical protein